VTSPSRTKVAPRQSRRAVEREKGHHGHPLVLDLAIAQDARLVGLVRHERLQQERPVRRDARRAMAADVGQVARAVLVVRRREDVPVVR